MRRLAVDIHCLAALLAVMCTAGWLPTAEAQLGVPTGNLCATLANCNGHGRCNTLSKTCTCYEGYGAPTDIALYKSPDCSMRTVESPNRVLLLQTGVER